MQPYTGQQGLESKPRLTNLDVHQGGKLSRLLKTVEAALFNHRPEELVRALQPTMLKITDENLPGLPKH